MTKSPSRSKPSKSARQLHRETEYTPGNEAADDQAEVAWTAPSTDHRRSGIIGELERNYQTALRDFHSHFDGDADEVERYFELVYNSKTFLRHTFFEERFVELSASENGLCTVPTKTKDKLALVAAHQLLPAVTLPNLLVNRVVGKMKSNHVRHNAEHDGFYRYWRYYPTVTKAQREPVRWGILELRTDSQEGTRVNHWSYDHIFRTNLQRDGQPVDWNQFIDPEDSGFALFSRDRMFLLAFRIGNIRLSIASRPTADEANEYQHGIMLTTSKTSRRIFSGGFAMVHESHPNIRKSLSYKEFRIYSKLRMLEEISMLEA